MPDQITSRRRLRLGVIVAAIAAGVIAGGLMLGRDGPSSNHAQAQQETQKTTDDKAAPQGMAVGVDRVRRARAEETMPVIGRFVALKEGVVAARIAGPVGVFEVEVGDRIEEGQLIARIVPDAFAMQVKLREAEVKQFQAQLETARATVKLRQQELDRLTGLQESPAFSQARLDDKRQELAVAESQVAEARGELESAKAQLGIAKLDLAYTEVTAPFAGIVTQRHTEEGAFISAGGAVASVLDDRRLELEADVPSSRAASLDPGTEVTFDVAGESGLLAHVRAVIPDENPQTRTRRVRFAVPAEAVRERVAANQSATISIPAVAGDAVLTVHKDAVLNRGGSRQVYVVADGKAELRSIRIGTPVGPRFEVIEGLEAGELVVVRGNERLRPGQAVVFEPPSSGAS
jgi:RND family efflux transporter MFP subunit